MHLLICLLLGRKLLGPFRGAFFSLDKCSAPRYDVCIGCGNSRESLSKIPPRKGSIQKMFATGVFLSGFFLPRSVVPPALAIALEWVAGEKTPGRRHTSTSFA